MSNIKVTPIKKTRSFSTTGHTPKVSRFSPEPEKPYMPSVYYTPKAWAKIWHTVDSVSTEVSWLGCVEKLGNDFLVTDIFVPKQEVTQTTTDILPEAEASLLYELVSNDICPSTLTLWGHSHVNMGVTPSGTDEQEVEDRLENSEMLIRTIHNKHREIKCDIYLPQEDLIFENVNSYIYVPELSTEDLADLNTKIKDNVQRKTYTYNTMRGKNNIGKKQQNYLPDYDLIDDYGMGYLGINNDYPDLLIDSQEETTSKAKVLEIDIMNPEDGLSVIKRGNKFFSMYGTELNKSQILKAYQIYSDVQFKCENMWEALDGTLHKKLDDMYKRHGELALQGLLMVNSNWEIGHVDNI